jgi:hypothetical protein
MGQCNPDEWTLTHDEILRFLEEDWPKWTAESCDPTSPAYGTTKEMKGALDFTCAILERMIWSGFVSCRWNADVQDWEYSSTIGCACDDGASLIWRMGNCPGCVEARPYPWLQGPETPPEPGTNDADIVEEVRFQMQRQSRIWTCTELATQTGFEPYAIKKALATWCRRGKVAFNLREEKKPYPDRPSDGDDDDAENSDVDAAAVAYESPVSDAESS